ncbi:hypothetical protein Btru_057394 [Bulinus truncatus]|nr:hypothetical protein Btru_057394 [Bulinus truncatus]
MAVKSLSTSDCRRGSLITDYIVSVNKSSTSDPKISLSAAMKAIQSEGISLNGSSVQVMQMTEDGNTVQPSSCDVKQRIDPCQASAKCVIENNIAVCKPATSKGECLQYNKQSVFGVLLCIVYLNR